MNGTNTTVCLVAVALLGGCHNKSRDHSGALSAGLSTAPAASLIEGRKGHTATRTGDGTVLVCGGETQAGAASASIELYDPDAGWSEALEATLAQARVDHGSWLLPDGRVWLIGGRDEQGQPLASTELFDPIARTVSPGPDLQAPRTGAALALLGDRFVIAGGRREPSVEVWDLNSLTPRSGAGFALPHPVEGAQLVQVEQDVAVLVGGRDVQGADLPPVWLDLAGGQAAAQEGGEWLHGGVGVAHPGLSGDEAWVLAGILESTGGYTRQGQRLRVPPSLGTGKVVDFPAAFSTDTFERMMVIGQARQRPTAVSTPYGVVVVGGTIQGVPSGVVEVIEFGRTAVGQALQVPRQGVVATLLDDGRVVLTGGRDTSGRLVALVEQLVPAGMAGPDAGLVFARRKAELAELARLQDELARVTRLLADEESQSARLRGRLDTALTELTRRQSEIATLQTQLAQAIAQLGQSQQQNQALTKQLQDLQAQLSSTQAALTAAQTQVANLQASLVATQNELVRLRAVETTLRGQLANAKAPPPPAPAPAPPPKRIRGPITGIVRR